MLIFWVFIDLVAETLFFFNGFMFTFSFVDVKGEEGKGHISHS